MCALSHVDSSFTRVIINREGELKVCAAVSAGGGQPRGRKQTRYGENEARAPSPAGAHRLASVDTCTPRTRVASRYVKQKNTHYLVMVILYLNTEGRSGR